MCVPVSGLDFKDSLTQLQDGNVEGSTTEVINGNNLVFPLVHAIGQRGSRWLVDDTQYLQPGNCTSIFGRLTLRIIEVGGYCNHSLGNALTQSGLCIGSQLLQNHSRYFRWTVFASIQYDTHVTVGSTYDFVGYALDGALNLWIIVFASHEPLNRKNRIFGIRHGLSFRDLANQSLTVLGNGYY